MSKNQFPLRVVAYDASGVARNVANLNDIVELAKEKANDHADAESQRYVKEHEADVAKIEGYDALKQAADKKAAAADKAPAAAKPTVVVGKSADGKPSGLNRAAAAAKATQKPAAKAAGKSTGKKAAGKK